MALNQGFDRYEGSAYFGYELEGDGFDAVVIIGRNLIEIRDADDNPLSQWMPGTYWCNQKDIPYRAYFNEGEWIAPREKELQDVLDRFVAPPERENAPKRELNFSWAWSLGLILLVGVIAFFALRPLTQQLLSPAIKESLEESLIATFQSNFELCNPSLSDATHDKIRGKFPNVEFQVFTALTQNYARLPTGRLAINSEFAQNLNNADTLISLLQLSAARNLEQDPAAELTSHFPFASRLQFLTNAHISDENLKSAWEEYAQTERFSKTLYRTLATPVGNFQNLSTKIGWDEGEYPSAATDIVLTDEEWLSLFTFCEKPN